MRIPLAALAAIALAACGTAVQSSSPPANGLTVERATEMATPIAQSSSSTVVVFDSAKSAHYGDFADGALVIPKDRWVWAVAFKGTFHSSGGPAPVPGQAPATPREAHSILVFIDYLTGDFIQASIPDPYLPDY